MSQALELFDDVERKVHDPKVRAAYKPRAHEYAVLTAYLLKEILEELRKESKPKIEVVTPDHN